MSDILGDIRGAFDAESIPHKNVALRRAGDEIERLQAIVRVNGLRWGHTHAEIDAILAGAALCTNKGGGE